MKFIKLIIFSFILISFTTLKARDRNDQLNKLFTELKIKNEVMTNEIEQKIWKIWSTHPNNKNLTEKLQRGSIEVRKNELSKALKIFTEVINLDPKWAEGWNITATVLYMMRDYEGSQKDIDIVLKLEKRHFGALAGQGLVNIQLKNYEKASESYEKAQEIYPSMQSPKIMIKQIENLIKQELI